MIGWFFIIQEKLRKSPIAARFLTGAGWSVMGSILSSAISLIMLMVLARLLGKIVYGQFVVIQSTLSMVGVFAGFGIGAAATRYAADLKTRNVTRLGHILTLAERTIFTFGLIASTGLVLSSEWMAVYILNSSDLRTPLAISACAILFLAIDGYQKSVLIGFESMRAFAVGTLVGVILGVPVMLIGAKYFGLQGASISLVINAFIQACVSRYQMTRVLRIHKIQRHADGCMNELPVLWRFALPALFSGVLVGPAHWCTQAMLANTPNGYAELAILGIAMQWFNIIMFVPGTAGRVILPMLTDHLVKNDHKSSRKILLYAMSANAVVTVPVVIVFSLMSPFILTLYGPSFADNSTSIILALMAAALVAIQSPIGNLLAASSRMWLGALMNAGWAVSYIVSAYFLVNRGAVGVMSAMMFAYIFHSMWVGYFAAKQLWKK